MRRRRVRKIQQSRLMLFLAMMIMFMVVAACTFRSIELSKRSRELRVTETALENQLNEANLRAEQLKEKEMYMQTKKYIEDEAKKKLGLVYPDEIVIKPKEKDN